MKMWLNSDFTLLLGKGVCWESKNGYFWWVSQTVRAKQNFALKLVITLTSEFCYKDNKMKVMPHSWYLDFPFFRTDAKIVQAKLMKNIYSCFNKETGIIIRLQFCLFVKLNGAQLRLLNRKSWFHLIICDVPRENRDWVYLPIIYPI